MKPSFSIAQPKSHILPYLKRSFYCLQKCCLHYVSNKPLLFRNTCKATPDLYLSFSPPPLLLLETIFYVLKLLVSASYVTCQIYV